VEEPPRQHGWSRNKATPQFPGRSKLGCAFQKGGGSEEEEKRDKLTSFARQAGRTCREREGHLKKKEEKKRGVERDFVEIAKNC